MVPSSITIKLDFGSDAGSYSVSGDGGVPTPFSSSALSAVAHGQSTEALPTPFSGAYSLGQAESAAPVPSLDLAPAGSTVCAGYVTRQGDVPTPLTMGGWSAASTGASSSVPPTPMDNPAYVVGVDSGPAPDPHMASPASADPSPPQPSQDDHDIGEQH
jgi:hypothetical protein